MSVSAYKDFIKSEEFRELENYSNSFLEANGIYLKGYAKRWVRDSLHQWSRQWEYPFVFDQIKSCFENKNAEKNILDAGSGVTFFPYYIKEKHAAAKVYCCDYDCSLDETFKNINSKIGNKVDFSCSTIQQTGFKNSYFDIIYCISVLEHTNTYTEIIDEFYRILKPNGKLIVTFDISLDGSRDIPINKAEELLKVLYNRFSNNDYNLSYDIHSQLSSIDAFTTDTAKKIDKHLLPWRYPSFIYKARSIFSGKGVVSWPPLLTVYCLSLSKREP